ncbi:MAG: quinolinate synthase NadA [Nitrospirae bacterium]|nr:quinolinate synthase NadA [Nitrospirota bacterium]
MPLQPSSACEFDYELEPFGEVPADVRATWQRIPDRYLQMDASALGEAIRAAKETLKARLVILGHHYQRDEIVRFADFTGDSYKLSRAAASEGREFIVFCGVHFMAETADILSRPGQVTILPNLTAGCSMADMAPPDDVEVAWAELREVTPDVVPVTYMNSAASLKALTGEHGGAVCTSSNAGRIIRWALQGFARVFFFPDQHLGRNTGVQMGIPLEEMALWDPRKPLGGNTAERLRRSRLILWQGHCSVHARFKVEQIRKARAEHPGVRVIVHPECTLDVVQAADASGSTEQIARQVESAPPGSVWAIGTEVNLVHRLAQQHTDKTVFCLDPIVCPCSTMYRIHPAYLAWVLDSLLEGTVVNRIRVPESLAGRARLALERMIQVTEAAH